MTPRAGRAFPAHHDRLERGAAWHIENTIAADRREAAASSRVMRSTRKPCVLQHASATCSRSCSVVRPVSARRVFCFAEEANARRITCPPGLFEKRFGRVDVGRPIDIDRAPEQRARRIETESAGRAACRKNARSAGTPSRRASVRLAEAPKDAHAVIVVCRPDVTVWLQSDVTEVGRPAVAHVEPVRLRPSPNTSASADRRPRRRLVGLR